MNNLEKKNISIQEKGDFLNLLRLKCSLGEFYESSHLKNLLDSYQFPDGSWDYQASNDKNDSIGSLEVQFTVCSGYRSLSYPSNPSSKTTWIFS